MCWWLWGCCGYGVAVVWKCASGVVVMVVVVCVGAGVGAGAGAGSGTGGGAAAGCGGCGGCVLAVMSPVTLLQEEKELVVVLGVLMLVLWFAVLVD